MAGKYCDVSIRVEETHVLCPASRTVRGCGGEGGGGMAMYEMMTRPSPLEGRVYELAAAPPGKGGRGAAARRAADQRHGAAEGVSCAARHHHPGPGLDTRGVRRHWDMAGVYHLLI